MLVCGIIIFELAVMIGLLVYFGIAARRNLNGFKSRWAVLCAHLDQIDRDMLLIKKDIDVKFGPDLVEKLNAVFKLGEHPKNIVLGKDGKFHKANRAY